MSTLMRSKSGRAGERAAATMPPPSGSVPVDRATKSTSPTWLLPGMIGVAVAMVVFLAGAWFVSGRSDQFAASGSVVVLPRTGNDSVEASYYETLGKGIVSTFAEVIRSAPISGAPAGASTKVTVSPDSTLLVIEGMADTAADAERIAQLRIDAGLQAVGGLTTPFRVEIIDRPAGSAGRSGLTKGTLIGASAIAAIALGVASAQGALVLRRPTRSSRS